MGGLSRHITLLAPMLLVARGAGLSDLLHPGFASPFDS